MLNRIPVLLLLLKLLGGHFILSGRTGAAEHRLDAEADGKPTTLQTATSPSGEPLLPQVIEERDPQSAVMTDQLTTEFDFQQQGECGRKCFRNYIETCSRSLVHCLRSCCCWAASIIIIGTRQSGYSEHQTACLPLSERWVHCSRTYLMESVVLVQAQEGRRLPTPAHQHPGRRLVIELMAQLDHIQSAMQAVGCLVQPCLGICKLTSEA